MSSKTSFEFMAHGTPIRMYWRNPNDHIPRQIAQHRNFYEWEMLEDVGHRVPEGALIVDVGANIGNHTVFFSRVLGNPTLAIEPNPAALQQLRRNLSLNGVEDRVEVHGLALGAGEGRGTVVDDDPGNLGRAHVKVGADGEVRIRSLDDLVGDRDVHLIKIDVEGMEPQVIEGARQTLLRCQPWLLVEAATLEALRPIEALLRPLGYRKRKVYNATPTYLFEHILADGGAMVTRLPARELACLPRTTQVVAGMATVVGNEEALRATVMSLLPQVDRLYLYLNCFSAAPRFVAENPKISWILDEDGRRYGDAGKFWGLPQAPDAVYLACDDDIVYPSDFSASMVRELAAHQGQAILAVHGSLLLQPCPGYYDMNARAVFHFEKALMRRRRVHVAASGTAAMHSSVVTMTLADFQHPNMADIWLARFGHRQRLPSYAVPRPRQWLRPLAVKRPTIYQHSVSHSGSAYDSSREQDKVLSSLYPLSLLNSPAGVDAHFIVAHTTTGLSALIAALAQRERDPAIFVFAHQTSGEIRQASLKLSHGCEVHLLQAGDEAAYLQAYARLLRDADVHCVELRDSGPRKLPADAWAAYLPTAQPGA